MVGKPGRCVSALQPGRVDGEQHQREDERRDHVRRLAERPHDRAAREQVDLVGGRRHAASSASPSTSPPRRRRRPRASGRSSRGRRRRARPGGAGAGSTETCSASRARTISARSASPASRTATPRTEATGSPKRGEDRRGAVASSAGSAGTTSTVGRPISAFSAAGRALGDDLAVVDDPDAVGEHVGLLEVLGGEEDGDAVVLREPREPPPRARSGSGCRGRSSARRGRGCAGGARARARGRAGASSRPSSPDPAVGGVGEADALEQLVGAWPRSCARQRLQARLQPQVLAAGEQRVERGLLQRGADRRCAPPGPALTTSKPATRARARGRRQERRQHQHRRRLAGAVRPEEAVDLARRDRAGRSRRPRAAPS